MYYFDRNESTKVEKHEKKAKNFAGIGPDVDSKFHRNDRVMYVLR